MLECVRTPSRSYRHCEWNHWNLDSLPLGKPFRVTQPLVMSSAWIYAFCGCNWMRANFENNGVSPENCTSYSYQLAAIVHRGHHRVHAVSHRCLLFTRTSAWHKQAPVDGISCTFARSASPSLRVFVARCPPRDLAPGIESCLSKWIFCSNRRRRPIGRLACFRDSGRPVNDDQ